MSGRLVLRSQDIWTNDGGIVMDIVAGSWREPPLIKGAHIPIPGRAGMLEGSHVKDIRRVLIAGHVKGMGTTVAQRWRSFDEQMATLATAIGDSTSALTTLVAYADYLGLISGTATLSSVHLDERGPMWGPIGPAFRTVSFYVVSIANPPDWVLA